IGEALFGSKTIVRATLAVILGAIIYRIVVTLALRASFLETGDMKLITAILVILALIAPKLLQARKEKKRKLKKRAALETEVQKMLNLKNISVTFNEGTPDEKHALNDVNLQLKSGEFVTVIGGNGAGKSTLMNVISGNLMADVGHIAIDEKEVRHLPEYKRSRMIGRVFQDPMAGTAPTMTIEENLAIAYSRNK